MTLQPACYHASPAAARRRCSQALIVRNHGGLELPAHLDAAVAGFLGGPHVSYYWPAPGQQRRVVDAVRSAFRHPVSAALSAAATCGPLLLPPLPMLRLSDPRQCSAPLHVLSPAPNP